jgi:ketosteroid isomerase-like protein
MPPNSPANAGREAIRAWSQAFLGAFRAAFALTVAEVQVAGDWAFERGGYDIALTPRAGGPPVQDHGKYMTIYRRPSEGPWRMARDIWNSDHPLPGTPS